MDVNYRFYEPNQGLEEIQAKIFNQANNRTVTGKEIQERFEREKIDPKTVIYAFTKENIPLAYIQARDYANTGETHLGQTWAMPDCPQDVKTRMFDDLLTYMKGRQTELTLKMNTSGEPEAIQSAKDKGFKPEQKLITFTIDLDSISKYDTSSLNYTLKKATMEDLDAISECYNKALGHVGRIVNEQFLTFLKGRIESGFLFLAFEGDEMIGVGGVQAPDLSEGATPQENLGVGPLFTLLKKENALPALMKHALEISNQENWNQNHIRIGFTDENPEEMDIMHGIAKETAVTGMRFTL